MRCTRSARHTRGGQAQPPATIPLAPIFMPPAHGLVSRSPRNTPGNDGSKRIASHAAALAGGVGVPDEDLDLVDRLVSDESVAE